MRLLFVFSLLLASAYSLAQQPQDLIAVPEPPELPAPIQSGEVIEPDITIIRKGKKTIQEFRRNGVLYMIKVKPSVGPSYYLIDSDGDGSADIRGNDLDRGSQINQWKIWEWE